MYINLSIRGFGIVEGILGLFSFSENVCQVPPRVFQIDVSLDQEALRRDLSAAKEALELEIKAKADERFCGQ